MVDCVCWRITVTKNELYRCHGYLLEQIAECRVQTGCKMYARYKMQTADCKEGTKCRLRWQFFRLVCDNMSSYNLPSVTQSLFCDQLSPLFALWWTIPGPFVDIISSRHIVFSLCTRVGCCHACTGFTNLIKVDVDLNEMSLSNI